MKQRLQLAYFSPLPPARSGIADYSLELLPYLGQHADVTLFADEPDSVAVDLAQSFKIEPTDQYPALRWQYDLTLYHMGNSSHHETIYQMLTRYPGLVVLHDYYVHLFLADRHLTRGEFAGYTQELGYALGQEGLDMAWEIQQTRRPHPFHDIALANRILDVSLGVIVHSEFVRTQLPTHHAPVQVIPALIEPRAGTSHREQLPWPADALIFACIGQVTAAKQVDMALRAFKQLQAHVPAYFLIVGEILPEVHLLALIEELGLQASVFCVGYVEGLEAFVDWIYTADVIVNLRYPTIGETSATALRALAAGRPLLVFDHGWYQEIPDGACLKVPPMDELALLEAMRLVAVSLPKRQELGELGQHYAIEQCHPSKIALAYMKEIYTLLNRYGGRWPQ